MAEVEIGRRLVAWTSLFKPCKAEANWLKEDGQDDLTRVMTQVLSLTVWGKWKNRKAGR